MPSKSTLAKSHLTSCQNVPEHMGDEHKGQEGSSPTQRFRFCGDGRKSYVDLIRKLIK